MEQAIGETVFVIYGKKRSGNRFMVSVFQTRTDAVERVGEIESENGNLFKLEIKEEPAITLDKKYKTRSGKDVMLSKIVLQNSRGNLVHFPVKGSIITKNKSGRKSYKYQVWSLAGHCFDESDPMDLILVKGV